jgi:flap endonuclease-1
MGVKLGELIKGIQWTQPDLSNKTMAIDASYTTMVFLNRKYGNNAGIPVDKTMRAISHLYGIMYRTINLLESGLLPVFCFDGIPDEMKRLSTKNKYNDFERTKERYNQEIIKGNKSSAKTIALGKEFLWMNSIREIRTLIHAMGIPYIDSPSEAEAQCAHLVKIGVCDYCNSSDFDVILYGSPNLLKIQTIKRRKINAIQYNSQEVYAQLGLNRFQVIDLSILIGNDYFPGVKSIGIKTGIELLKKYTNLEKIIKFNEQYGSIIHQSIEMDRISSIRKQFLLPWVIEKLPDLSITFPKRAAILELMCKDHALEENKINMGINRIERAYNSILKSKRLEKEQLNYGNSVIRE